MIGKSWTLWPYIASFLHNYPAFSGVQFHLFYIEMANPINDNQQEG